LRQHSRHLIFSLSTLLTATSWAANARAFEAEVESSTVTQTYALSSPWGSPNIKRSRFLETLALGVYHLEGDKTEPGGPEIFVKVRMRVDADLGMQQDEYTYDATSNRFVPGLTNAPVDLMYGYVEGRNLAHGYLGFRLGRQYVADSLGWWAFDGGMIHLTTPFFVQAEVYGGLEERGGLPLSTPRFERNGIWRGDRGKFELGFYPQFQSASIAPAYGFAIESAGVSFLHGRFDYRKVYNRGASVIAMLPDPAATEPEPPITGTRVSSERLGYAMDASAANVGGVKGGLVYDLYNAFFSAWYAGADWFGPAGLTIGADYDYFRPTFDADSIFNFFAHSPMRTITGRIDWTASEHFSVAASGGIRTFYTYGDPTTFATANNPSTEPVALNDTLGNLAARYRWASGNAGIRSLMEQGDRGKRRGGELYAEKQLLGRRWSVHGRTSVYDWQDNLRPDRAATSFAYVLGGGFQPSEVVSAGVEWEHDMNRLVGQRYRILAFLNLRVGK
jgi:hypothetical protein